MWNSASCKVRVACSVVNQLAMAQLLSQARSSAGPCYGVPVKRLITCVKPLTRVCVRSSTNSNKANVTTVAADAETAKSTVTEDAYYLASKRLHTLLQDAALR